MIRKYNNTYYRNLAILNKNNLQICFKNPIFKPSPKLKQ